MLQFVCRIDKFQGDGAAMTAANKLKRIFVFGGFRGIGHWFSNNVFPDFVRPDQLYICDIKLPNLIRASDRNHILIEFETDGIKDLPKDIGVGDLIVFSVPERALDQLCSNLKKHISSQPLVLNFSSVQMRSQETIKRHLGTMALCVGVHPLFGPKISSSQGQTLIVTDYSSDSVIFDSVLTALADKGFYIEQSTSVFHDEMMSYVQVATHFMYLSFATLLKRSNMHLEDLQRFGTPPYLFLASFMTRILSSGAETYENIQSQPGAAKMRSRLIAAARDLNKKIGKRAPQKKSRQSIERLSKHFTKTEMIDSNVFSDRATSVFRELLEQEEVAKRTRAAFAILHSVAGSEPRILIGQIEENHRGEIVFLESTVRKDDKIAVFYDEMCKTNYGRIGAQPGKAIKVRLKKRNYRVLSNDELLTWEKKNLLLVSVSRGIPIAASLVEKKDIIARWCKNLYPGLHEIEFENFIIDDQGKARANCKFLIDPRMDFEAFIDDLRSLLQDK